MTAQKRNSLQGRTSSRDIYSKNSWHRFYHDRIIIDNDLAWPLFPYVFMDSSISGVQWCQHYNYPHAAVEIILEGVVEYVMDSKIIKASPGDIFLIVPGSCVKIINSKDKAPRRKMVLIIGGNATKLLCENVGFCTDVLIKPEDCGHFKEMLTRISGGMKNDESHESLSQLVYILLTDLAAEYRRSGVRLPKDMLNLKNYLNNNFNAFLSIDDMAAFCGCSKSTLIRRFKASFNTTPQLFLNTLRLKQACIMLKETELPVKEIAFKCGFSTSSHFGAIFRKVYGKSPAAYRSS